MHRRILALAAGLTAVSSLGAGQPTGDSDVLGWDRVVYIRAKKVSMTRDAGGP